jgi:uncharacterized protein
MALSMDEGLLEILCCPVSRQPLRMADATAVKEAAARSGRAIEEGLIREDGQVFYPIQKGIPLLIPEEGIALA